MENVCSFVAVKQFIQKYVVVPLRNTVSGINRRLQRMLIPQDSFKLAISTIE